MKPRIDVDHLKQQVAATDEERFLLSFYYRTASLLHELAEGNLPAEVIALETLQSALSYLGDGHSHEEILGAYPVEDWRKNTVTVPMALLEALVSGWGKYKDAPSGVSFDEVLHLKTGGQGKQPAKKTLEKLNRHARYSNDVLIEYLSAPEEGGSISYEEAIARVADREGVSFNTIKNASEQRRKLTLSNLKTEKALK